MKRSGLMIFLLIPIIAFSQEVETNGDSPKEKKSASTDKPSVRDRILFGGSFGASFGDYTFFSIAPIIGYKLSPTFSIGGGLIYQYSEYKQSNYSANNYGGRAFGMAKVYGPLFAQLEYEYLMYRYNSPFSESINGDYSSLFGGGGIAQPISKNVFFMLTALYNFTYQNNFSGDYRPYESPWVFRVGINAGF